MADGVQPVRPGELIGAKYRVERVLGQGGMAVVVAARHLDLDELVAIKILLPHRAELPDVRARFATEARAAAKIKSEHVARVTDVGALADGTPYMVMEYLDGDDLASVLSRRGKLPSTEAILYALQICDALREAHSLGIIHRDIKPANLFLAKSRGRPPSIKVLDFGISKVERHDRRQTDTKEVLGSPWYMAPEHLRRAHSADARSDIWSLGIILYEFVTGAVPFEGESMTEVIVKVLHDEFLVGDSRPELPAALEGIIRRCLAKDPADRYETIDDLAMALRALERPLSADVRSSGAPQFTPAPPATSKPPLPVAASKPPLPVAASKPPLPVRSKPPLPPRSKPPTPPPASAAPRVPIEEKLVVLADGIDAIEDDGDMVDVRELLPTPMPVRAVVMPATPEPPRIEPDAVPVPESKTPPEAVVVDARTIITERPPARKPVASQRDRLPLMLAAAVVSLGIVVALVLPSRSSRPRSSETVIAPAVAQVESPPATEHETVVHAATAAPIVVAPVAPVATVEPVEPKPAAVAPSAAAPIAVAPVPVAPVAVAEATRVAPPPAPRASPRTPAPATAPAPVIAAAPAPASASRGDDASVGFQVARRNHAGVRDCWLDSAKTTNLVTVVAWVDASGAVTSANAAASDAPLARCVEGKVRTWSFPAGADMRTFRIPIRLGRN